MAGRIALGAPHRDNELNEESDNVGPNSDSDEEKDNA